MNFEADTNGGYRRVDGYERWGGGRTSSSIEWSRGSIRRTDGNVSVISSFSDPVRIRGANSGATATVLADVLSEPNYTMEFALTIRDSLPSGSGFTRLAPGSSRSFYFYDVTGSFEPGEPIEFALYGLNNEVSQWVLSGGESVFPISATFEIETPPSVLIGSDVRDHAIEQDRAALSWTVSAPRLRHPNDSARVVALVEFDGDLYVFQVGTAVSTQEDIYVSRVRSDLDLPTYLFWERVYSLPAGTSAGVDRLEWVKHNFSGGPFGERVYFVTGKGPAFSWHPNDMVFTPIPTGMVDDRPQHIEAHSNRLWLSFWTSVQFSEAGDPLSWTPVLGAGEIATGEDIIKLQSVGSGENPLLLVYTKTGIQGLYGATLADFRLTQIATNISIEPDSIAMLDRPIFLTNRGITTLDPTDRFGNFAANSLSDDISPWLVSRRRRVTSAVVVRALNQYRLFFEDGDCLYCSFKGGQLVGMMPVKFDRTVRLSLNYISSTREEITVFAPGSTRYVFRMDSGPSFDFEPIVSHLMMAFTASRTARIRKHYRRVSIDVQSDGGYVAFGVVPDVDYARMDALPSPTLNVQNPNRNEHSNFDESGWDLFVWDGHNTRPAELSIEGAGENFSLVVSSHSRIVSSFTIAGVSLHYIERRITR